MPQLLVAAEVEALALPAVGAQALDAGAAVEVAHLVVDGRRRALR